MLAVWPEPQVPDALLAAAPSAATKRHTLEKVKHLHGDVLDLYHALHDRVTGLDARIVRVVRRHTIEYKLDHNFVSLQPQRDRIAIWLNVGFGELEDPKAMTADVSNVGHFGSGDVRLNLDGHARLDDVMALVRQSYERHGGGVIDAPPASATSPPSAS